MRGKALSMPLTLVVVAVILIVVTMVLISIFGGSSQKFTTTTQSIGNPAACSACIINYCLQKGGSTETADAIASGECSKMCNGLSCDSVTCQDILSGKSPKCW